MSAAENPHRQGMLIAATGVLVLSFDALLVRLAATDGWNVAFWRGWFIFLSMAVLFAVRGTSWRPAGRPVLIAASVAVLMYGLNNVLFVLSVSHTKVANTVVILSCSPFFAALFSWLFLHERVRWRTLVAIIICVTGVAVVFVGSMGGGTLLGDGLALLLCVSLGVTLTILRRFPDIPRIPLACGSGLVAGLLSWPFADPLSLATASYGWLAIMGLAQMPLATLLIMTATRYLPSPEVSLFLLIETVLGPVWVWFVVGEEPPSLTLFGGMLILATIATHSWLSLRDPAPSMAAGASASGAPHCRRDSLS